jgi:hypothetical protein
MMNVFGLRCINSINNKINISILFVIGYEEIGMLKLLVYMYLCGLVHGSIRFMTHEQAVYEHIDSLMLCRCYPSRANIDGFTRVISASGVERGL